MGKLFSIGIITSSLISMPISWMPNHENLLLFLIGLFTIYLVLAGNRALTFKPRKKRKAAPADKIISGSMFFLSGIMILWGLFGFAEKASANILFLFFGGLGLFLTIKDFLFYRNLEKNTNNAWLFNHIGKMIGAFIASVTAFIVAGLNIGNLFAWISPSILGAIYIVYWQRKSAGKALPNNLSE